MTCALVELSFVILSSDFRFSFFVITLVGCGFWFVECWGFVGVPDGCLILYKVCGFRAVVCIG